MRPRAATGRSAPIPPSPGRISMRPGPAAPGLPMTSQGALANDTKSGREAIGRSRGGLTTKIHLAADLRCRPIARLTSCGQHGDSPRFVPLMDAIRIPRRGLGRPRRRPGRAMADKAYSSRANRAWLLRHHITAVIPVKEDQKKHRRDRGRAGGRPPSTPAGTKSATRWNAALPSSSSSAPWPPATTSASAFTRAPSTSPRSASGYATPSHDPRDALVPPSQPVSTDTPTNPYVHYAGNMGVPLLTLCAAVVKCACQVWFKDSAFATGASTSVVDVIAAKVSEDLDQRNARRFFEDLELPIARKLSVLRETEYSDVPDNEWAAAVAVAGQTFDRANLTREVLLNADLNPLFLERQVRKSIPSSGRDLSASGTALCDRIISEGCAYVIQISDNLPHFQAGAFAELLTRTTQLLSLVDELLEGLPQHKGVAEQGQRFTTAYWRHIAIKLDQLEIFGVDFPIRRYPLSVAYISLQARGHEAGAREEQIETVLASSPYLLIVGPAGSGKTTLLQWLAVSPSSPAPDHPAAARSGKPTAPTATP